MDGYKKDEIIGMVAAACGRGEATGDLVVTVAEANDREDAFRVYRRLFARAHTL